MGRARVGRPADPFVARLLVPARSCKADAAQHAVGRGTDPVAQLPSRRSLPAERMPSLQHRFPATPVVALRHPLQGQAAEIPDPTPKRRNRLKTVRRRHPRDRIRHARSRVRQPEPRLRGHLRQHLAGRRQRQPALAILPVGKFAQQDAPSRNGSLPAPRKPRLHGQSSEHRNGAIQSACRSSSSIKTAS